jgi:hypothetical protein
MSDPVDDTLAPAVIERALTIFDAFKHRGPRAKVQARKAVTNHVFGLISAGHTEQHSLVVSALTFLKSLDARAELK